MDHYERGWISWGNLKTLFAKLITQRSEKLSTLAT